MRSAISSVLTAAAVALSVSAASAADLPVKAPPLLPAPVWNWTGFYVGVHGGLGGNEFEYPFNVGPILGVTASGSASAKSSGFFGGAQIGYNWQFAPAWVAGLEADFAGSNIEDTLSLSAAALGIAANASAGTKLDWFGTVRGRVGYLVIPNALLYVTGGWAYGRTTTSFSASATGIGSASSSLSHDKSGWTVGAGLEYAFNRWISVKTEYLYLDLGTDNIASGSILGLVPYSVDEKTTVHTVKVGLNVKFSSL